MPSPRAARDDPGNRGPALAPGTTFLTTVSGADGPRAPVPDPPFDDTAPLLGITVEPYPADGPEAVRPFLHLDLTGRPEAAALVRGERRPGSTLRKALNLFVHSTGNAYVGLTLVEEPPAATDTGEATPPPRTLKLALDPVAHAAALTAAARTGGLVLAHQWASSAGEERRALLPMAVDSALLGRIVEAALTHPRSVPVTIT